MSLKPDEPEDKEPLLRETTTESQLEDPLPARNPRNPLIWALCLAGALAIAVTVALALLGSTGRLHPLRLGTPRKGLVIAGLSGHKVTWLPEVADWDVYHYIADDPAAALSIPRNQGREAMVYLTFIIDHYYDLPDYVAFIHGHDTSWHQPQPIAWLLRALNLDTVEEEGYVNLKCSQWGRCVDIHLDRNISVAVQDTLQIFRGYFEFVFRPDDPWYQPLPSHIIGGCCAQFVVSRARILSHPIEFWRRARLPMMRDLETEFVHWDPNGDFDWSWRVGNMFEMSWHWIFGKGEIHCVSEEWCERAVFGNKIECDGKIDGNVTLKEAHEGYMNINCTYLDDRDTIGGRSG